jgi:hypothetical protein
MLYVIPPSKTCQCGHSLSVHGVRRCHWLGCRCRDFQEAPYPAPQIPPPHKSPDLHSSKTRPQPRGHPAARPESCRTLPATARRQDSPPAASQFNPCAAVGMPSAPALRARCGSANPARRAPWSTHAPPRVLLTARNSAPIPESQGKPQVPTMRGYPELPTISPRQVERSVRELSGIPGGLASQNQPADWKLEAGRLSITAGKQTDWFISPIDRKRHDNSPRLIFHLPSCQSTLCSAPK